MQKYEAIIFDLDGTLIDSPKLWEKAYVEVLGNRDIHFTSDHFTELYPAGLPFTEWAKELGIHQDLVPGIRKERDVVYEELLRTETALYSDAEMALAELMHMPRAIVTGSHRSYISAINERTDLSSISDILITVDDVERGKPDPEGLLKAAAALGAIPGECLYIGDQPFDALAAKNAGMDSVIVRREYTPDVLHDTGHTEVHLLTELLP